ncbi:hypothetical protein [Streptomyces griseorubiginosus]|uniref:hypothetical protein n=1 Tax=Streptomyces griseorubiginosus TaxID=67304 RepID=UPI001AD78DFE|nr:hypothetical protein [Streptomyces griseorubiginosus]MBO4258539.1 hypothetical protein [Streptomyces griseorubiginosus]
MSGTELTVTLSGATAADARAVVRVLEPAFGQAKEEPPADEDVTVHTARFAHDPADRPDAPASGGPGHLSGAVTVTVQGAPDAVALARESLTHAFTAQDQGSVSGDQEQEWQLLLEP